MNCKLFESTDFYVPKIIRIIAAGKERMKKMTTLTINYDETKLKKPKKDCGKPHALSAQVFIASNKKPKKKPQFIEAF